MEFVGKLQAIPQISGIENRKTVPIIESHEILVTLDGQTSRLICAPQYKSRGYKSALSTMWVREGVAKRLKRAAESLPQGLALLIWDAWRPTALQTELFEEQICKLRREYPGRSEDEVRREAEIYVSVPTYDPTSPAPHSTGGAIDLTIATSDGVAIEMGTGFDCFGPGSDTRYYEKLAQGKNLSEELQAIQKNRRLLFWIMKEAGFTNYREEWWHYDFGDQFWGAVKRRPAIYGGIEPHE